jgi:ATP adenylyltransferase
MAYLRSEGMKPEGCIFCHKVGAKDEEELIVFRSTFVYVTLNLYPYNNGHLLVVPYEHTADITSLKPEALTDLMRATQEAVTALRAIYGAPAFNIGINQGAAAGAGIAEHLHLHIVPRWPNDANYMTVIGQTRVIPDSLTNTYTQLRSAWPQNGP